MDAVTGTVAGGELKEASTHGPYARAGFPGGFRSRYPIGEQPQDLRLALRGRMPDVAVSRLAGVIEHMLRVDQLVAHSTDSQAELVRGPERALDRCDVVGDASSAEEHRGGNGALLGTHHQVMQDQGLAVGQGVERRALRGTTVEMR